MKSIRTVKNPIVGMFFFLFCFLISCEKNSETSYETEATSSFSYDYELYETASTLLQSIEFYPSRLNTIEANKALMSQLQDEAGISVTFSDQFYSLNDNTASRNWEIADSIGAFSAEDQEVLQGYVQDIHFLGLEEAKENLTAFINQNISSSEKQDLYSQVIVSIDLMLDINPNILSPGEGKAEMIDAFDWGCAWAVAGFAAACVGLATLEVASGGLATAGVVVGYCAASASLTMNC